MTFPPPHRLLVVAHGTASPQGRATTSALVGAVRAARPGSDVDLCFLDVAEPRLPDVLDDRPTIAVPLLLSTGYHVQADIPAAVAAYREVRVSAHLGPDPMIVDAVAERLGAIPAAASVLLVAAGSSRPAAAEEVQVAADLLAARVGRPVAVATVGADLPGAVAALPPPVAVATYLLAPGRFTERIAEVVDELLGSRGRVAEPIGVHARLTELVWKRHDETLAVR